MTLSGINILMPAVLLFAFTASGQLSQALEREPLAVMGDEIQSQCALVLELSQTIHSLANKVRLKNRETLALDRAKIRYETIREKFREDYFEKMLSQNSDQKISEWFSGDSKELRAKNFIDVTLTTCIQKPSLNFSDATEIAKNGLKTFLSAEK